MNVKLILMLIIDLIILYINQLRDLYVGLLKLMKLIHHHLQEDTLINVLLIPIVNLLLRTFQEILIFTIVFIYALVI